ncbi:MAG: alkaline phosphatase family protein, partial [Pirellulales bacterium]
MKPLARKVLVLGWDAADWKVIRPLLNAGMMPNLAGLMARGVSGNIATLYPVLSPTLWTSIATGKRPFKHGVLGFSEPTRDGLSVQPCSILSRTTKAVWNILAQEGKRSIVVGWWPSYPAEPIPGAMVSNHFQHVPDDADVPTPPLAPGIVSPPRIAAEVADLRVKPTEVPLEVLRMFVPRCDEVDQATDKSLHTLAKMIAETLSIHAAATDLLEREPWDFAAVYFDTIDHACHGFMRYHPPRQQWVPEREFELYRDIVANVYRHHDAMLGRYLELAGPDTHVLLLSDHGFHADERRLSWIPAEPAGPADEHRHFGIVTLAGPGIRQGEQIHGTSVLDITPTVLALFGLPVGEDMDGSPQVQAWETTPEVARIPSWDDVPGADGRHPPEAGHDPRAAAAQLEQLVALGYVAPMPDDREKAVRETVRELDYNLARALGDGGKPHEGIPILERLWEEWPSEHRFGTHLIGMYARVGRVAERRRALDMLCERAERFAAEAKEKLAALAAEEAQDKATKADQADAAADALEQETLAAKRRQFERRQLTQLAAGLRLDRFETEQAMLEGDREAAAAAIAPLLALEAAGSQLSFEQASLLATRLVDLGRLSEALPIVERLLDADPETPALASLKAEILFRRRDWSAVVEAAAEGLALVYFNPRLHMLLGLALARLDQSRDAINELLVAVRQNPSLVRAYAALERLHRHDPLRALEYRRRGQALREQIRAARREQAAGGSAPTAPVDYDFTLRCQAAPTAAPPAAEEVIVVSGLPRSGTSMLMRVLEAGGLPILADGLREADENNRLGYYEFEPVKKLGRDTPAAAWIGEAAGKAVKVVAPLVRHLPGDVPTRLLVLHRPLAQVLASQEAMKGRLGTSARGSADGLARQFIVEIDGIDRLAAARPAWQVLHVAYERMLADPAGECQRIGEFLGPRFSAAAA